MGGTDFHIQVRIPDGIADLLISTPCRKHGKGADKGNLAYDGPVYIRFGRAAVPVINDRPDYKFEIGKGSIVREGKDVTIVATGICVDSALGAAEKLAADGIEAQAVLCHQGCRRAGLSEYILHTQLLNRGGQLCTQAITDCAAKAADDGMLFHGYHFARLFCTVNDNVLVQRLDGADAHYEGIYVGI